MIWLCSFVFFVSFPFFLFDSVWLCQTFGHLSKRFCWVLCVFWITFALFVLRLYFEHYSLVFVQILCDLCCKLSLWSISSLFYLQLKPWQFCLETVCLTSLLISINEICTLGLRLWLSLEFIDSPCLALLWVTPKIVSFLTTSTGGDSNSTSNTSQVLCHTECCLWWNFVEHIRRFGLE